MNNWGIYVTGISLIIGYLWYRGYVRLNAFNNQEYKLKEKNGPMELIGSCAYHGGLPQMPKPTNARLALSSGYLLLYTEKGVSSMVQFDKIRNVERFQTRTKPDPQKTSFVLMAPFAAPRVKIRHFILINYMDIYAENNNILLEVLIFGNFETMYGRIRKKWLESKYQSEN